MHPSFNTAGPCLPGEHYMVPPGRRLGRALELIEEGKYFTLIAGRQTGRTTSLSWLVEHLGASRRVAEIWVELHAAREQPALEEAMPVIVEQILRAATRALAGVVLPSEDQVRRWLVVPQTAVSRLLGALAAGSPHPLVVLFDEVDGLVGPTMVSFLTQLRAGYIERSQTPFPRSVVLVGMRQVRDYVLAEEDRRAVSWLGTTSPFNITSESVTLAAFTPEDVSDLLAQHTAATGQPFEPAAVSLVFELSQGQPWLVNALADQAVSRSVPDRSSPVTAAHIEAAKEAIILERRTHIDSLVARLREPRVRRILDPMLAGERAVGDVLDDDFAYVISLGLLRRAPNGLYEIANPIYREVVPRALTYVAQGQIPLATSRFVRPDGSLDVPLLLREWQVFWREDGHLAAEGFSYRESGPHLMLMAFLQRVVNGGGRIRREYGLGRRALDLLVEWKDERHIIEVKLRRDAETEERALSQVTGYMESLGLTEAWLVMFDLRSARPWEERLFLREEVRGGRRVHLVGC